MVIDCAYNELMVEKELQSVTQQVSVCWSTARRAQNPLALGVCESAHICPLLAVASPPKHSTSVLCRAHSFLRRDDSGPAGGSRGRQMVGGNAGAGRCLRLPPFTLRPRPNETDAGVPHSRRRGGSSAKDLQPLPCTAAAAAAAAANLLNRAVPQHYTHLAGGGARIVFQEWLCVALKPSGPGQVLGGALETDCVYVIGGLVDRMVLPGRSFSRASAGGGGCPVRTVRLPLAGLAQQKGNALNITTVRVTTRSVVSTKLWLWWLWWLW